MRSTVVCFLALAIILPTTAKEQTLASDLNAVPFQWELRDRSFLDAQRTFLNERNGQVGALQEKDPDKRNPVAVALYVAVGVAAISALAESIVKTLKDYKHGGIIVDMQGPTIKVTEHPSLERGQVIIRKPKTGEVVSYTYKPEASTDLTPIIASLLAAAKQP